MRRLFLCIVLCIVLLPVALPVGAAECTFVNPLVEFGQDPSVVFHDGFYYMVQSSGGLNITRSETLLTGLGREQAVQVFTPPPGEEYSYDLWAPELQYIDGEWYIYVAATNSPGYNPSHRMFVLQADTDDPLGTWSVQGKVYDPEADKWAIDGIVFEYNDTLYMVWSGWPGDEGDFPQNLYIAEMSDPLTLSSQRSLISEPDQLWESSEAAIQEGPQTFMHNGQLSIVYSADASWMPAYKLGMLVLTGDDPLNRNSWTKVGPIFEALEEAQNPVYGPGHNSNPVPSPDGSESWFLYHAKRDAAPGWDDRALFIQEFSWSEDNTPVFGDPIPAQVAQPIPAGEPCGLMMEFDEIEREDIDPAVSEFAFFDAGEALLNTSGSFTVVAEVQLANTDADYAFVSQEGGITSNFVLGLENGKLAFTMYTSMGQESTSAESQTAPEVDQWYQVVGVYDSPEQQLLLYVDGELQNTATFTEPWSAMASTIIGAARRAAKRVDVFDGEIRNVQLFSGALSAEEIQALEREPA